MNASLITSDSAASCCMLMPQYIRTLWSIGLEHQCHNLSSGWNIDGFCEQSKLRKSFNDEQVCNECPTRPTVWHCNSVLDSGHLTTIKQQRFKPQCLRWKKARPFFFIWRCFFQDSKPNNISYQHYIYYWLLPKNAKKCASFDLLLRHRLHGIPHLPLEHWTNWRKCTVCGPSKTCHVARTSYICYR